MLSEAGVVPGPLRWSVGDRVECWWRQSKADEGCWVAGTVVSHWWRHAEWPEAQVAPYQVQLDDGKLIFALRDDDDCIREATPLLGLDPERPERRELTAAEAAAIQRAQRPPAPFVEEKVAWKTAKTADGKTYYYHPVTKEVAWDDPEKGGKIHKPPGADLVQGHGHAHDHDHGHEDLEDALPPPAPGGDGDGAPDGAVRLPDDVRRAASEGDMAAVERWLRGGGGDVASRVHARDGDGRTLLMTAVCGGRGTDALVASLIELKADVNAEAGNMKITALMYAALKGREAATAMLLRAGAACDAQDSRGGSAIFLATMLGHAHVVSQLIAANADASRAHPAIGMSAKDLAKEANHTAVVDLLTKKGGTGTTRQPPSADAAAALASLHWMASDRGGALAEKMGAHVLHMATHARAHSIAQLAAKDPHKLPDLLKKNLDPRNIDFWLARGGSADAANDDGVTLLMRAATLGKTAEVSRLLGARAAPDRAEPKHGRTPLMVASATGHAEVVALLLRGGATADALDPTGSSSLHKAASMGRVECVRLLLQAGAARAVRDGQGRTPLQMAEERGHSAVAVLLRGDRQPKSEKAAGKEKARARGQAAARHQTASQTAAAAAARRRRPRPRRRRGAGGGHRHHSRRRQQDAASNAARARVAARRRDVRALGAAVQKWRGEGGGIDALYPPAGHTR